MIAEFKVENFLSIGSEQTLSFIATKDKTNESDYVTVMPEGTPLLKLAMVFGANATGKSNILKALEFFFKMVVAYPDEDEPMDYRPFLFSNEYKDKPTRMELTFYYMGRRHVLLIRYNKRAIVEEKLSVYFTNRATVIYERKYSNERGAVVYFSEKATRLLKVDKAIVKSHTHINCTVIAAYVHSGNVASSKLGGIYDYFKNNFPGRFSGTGNMVERAKKLLEEKSDADTKAFLEDWMENGGFEGIDDITIDKDSRILTFGYHNEDEEPVNLPENDESSGERRFLGLGALIYQHFTSDCLIVIDGLDLILHPKLRRYFLRSFLKNSQKYSQLIFTTNAYYILDREFIRRDTVWFTEKCNFETLLIRLSDCNIRARQLVHKLYKQGKIVKLPIIGDHFIDLTKYTIVSDDKVVKANKR